MLKYLRTIPCLNLGNFLQTFALQAVDFYTNTGRAYMGWSSANGRESHAAAKSKTLNIESHIFVQCVFD